MGKEQQQPNRNQKQKQLNSYIKYSGLGFQMLLTMILAAWGGLKLDEHFKVKNHWFTIGLLLFAVIASLYLVIKTLTANNEK